MHRGVIDKECEWTRKNAKSADRPIKWILYPTEKTFSKTSMDLLFARGETSSSHQQYPITQNLRAAVIIETRLDVFPLRAISQYFPPSYGLRLVSCVTPSSPGMYIRRIFVRGTCAERTLCVFMRTLVGNSTGET